MIKLTRILAAGAEEIAWHRRSVSIANPERIEPPAARGLKAPLETKIGPDHHAPIAGVDLL